MPLKNQTLNELQSDYKMFSHLKNMQCTIQHYTAARHCTGDSPQFTGPRLPLSPADTLLASCLLSFPSLTPGQTLTAS